PEAAAAAKVVAAPIRLQADGSPVRFANVWVAPLDEVVGLDAPRAQLDDSDWPPYRRMDYGDVLHWTYQVGADRNIAQKGIAVRLDGGDGGLSRGHAFVVYDQDTMALSAAWTGRGFIDWKGVAFDGSHNSHASIVGDVLFTNPVGPGWAKPGTTSFADERLVGRDGRRFGPLPRAWLRFRGRRDVGGRTLLEYDVGDARVRELPGCDEVASTPVFTRTLEVGASVHDLWLRVAPADAGVTVRGASRDRPASMTRRDGHWVVRIRAGSIPARVRIAWTAADARVLDRHEEVAPFARDFAAMAAPPRTR
ncbi:MAG: hypothetical protein KAI24_20450, partial [Planctomycetes bacterium]|nr:hypothetical protein [Planctomycetota bacterium]